MNHFSSRQRKIFYLVGIILLLIPIIFLGIPSSPSSRGKPGHPGGVLAQLRTKHDLGENTLGNVDPSSSTMNLVLLGFRGLATSMLWNDLDHYKNTKNWAQMKATTESIIMLQPHYQKVWTYNGWNLAFNVSVEWDDVRDRYFWVKEGTKFFRRGTERNQKFPELYWYTGDTLGKKVGRSDEWRQFRKFFLRDPDPKYIVNDEPGPDTLLNPDSEDNYLVAKKWFQKANDIMSTYQKEQHIMAGVLFRSYPARAQLDYAGVRVREGKFDEETRAAWRQGFVDWTQKYGQEAFDTPGGKIQLEWTADEIAKLFPDDEKMQLNLRYWVSRYQDMTHYRYWRSRTLAEREPNTLAAHYELYQAQQTLLEGDTIKGEELALSGMGKFEKMLTDYPDLTQDVATIEEGLLGQMVWRACMQLNGTEMPEDYPLKELWSQSQERLPEVQQEFERRFSPE